MFKSLYTEHITQKNVFASLFFDKKSLGVCVFFLQAVCEERKQRQTRVSMLKRKRRGRMTCWLFVSFLNFFIQGFPSVNFKLHSCEVKAYPCPLRMKPSGRIGMIILNHRRRTIRTLSFYREHRSRKKETAKTLLYTFF